MKRVLHIFRKDIRHLWPHATGLLLLMAITAIVDPTIGSGEQSSGYNLLVGFALPAACWLLIISVIYEEKLPGDRQYWLTRPYDWRELLAAKVLFIAVFINLPLFLWHAAVFLAAGVPLGEHLPALLWRQAFFTAFYILPVAAFAALTRNFGRLILTAIAVLAPAFLLETFLLARLSGGLHGIGETATAAVALIITLGVALILVIQYSRRATRRSRMVAGATMLAILLAPPATGWLVGVPPQPRQPPIRISLDPSPGRHSTLAPPASRNRPNLMAFDIPVRFDGVPDGIDVMQDYANLAVEGIGNPRWRPEGRTDGGFHDVANGAAWLTLLLDRRAGESQAPPPVAVRGTARFLAFANRQLLPLPRGRTVTVERVGSCSDTRDSLGKIALICFTPSPRAAVMIGTSRLRLNWIIPQGLVEPSIPTASGFQPLTRFTSLLSYRSWEDIGDTQLMVAEPRPPVSVSFELPEVRLTDYAAR